MLAIAVDPIHVVLLPIVMAVDKNYASLEISLEKACICMSVHSHTFVATSVEVA